MPEIILLQAALAAAYFLEIALIIILITGVTGFWIYFTKIDLKKQKEKTSTGLYIIRLLKSIGWTTVIIIVLFLLLIIWNPTFE